MASQRCILILTQIIAGLVFITMITFSTYFISNVQDRGLVEVVRYVYLILFSIILASAERGVEILLFYVNFLEYRMGRGLYIIFLGSILVDPLKLQTAMGFLIMVGGVVYIIISRQIQQQQEQYPQAQQKVEEIQIPQKPATQKNFNQETNQPPVYTIE